jgi:hypothetical protein
MAKHFAESLPDEEQEFGVPRKWNPCKTRPTCAQTSLHDQINLL